MWPQGLTKIPQGSHIHPSLAARITKQNCPKVVDSNCMELSTTVGPSLASSLQSILNGIMLQAKHPPEHPGPTFPSHLPIHVLVLA